MLFSPPKPSYNESHPHLRWIPKSLPGSPPRVPVLFFECEEKSSKLVIFFHGKSEDMNNCSSFAWATADILGVS